MVLGPAFTVMCRKPGVGATIATRIGADVRDVPPKSVNDGPA